MPSLLVLVSMVLAITAAGPDVEARLSSSRQRAAGTPTEVLAGCTGTDPAWSPDGEWLALVVWCDGESDLWRIRPDGSRAEQLTAGAAHEHAPVWFPDGSEILFSARLPEEDSELWAVPAGGGQTRRITDDDLPQSTPSLSPDGRRVVYESRRNDNADLFVLDLESGAEDRLTDSPEPELYPRWSPDGSLIAFQARRNDRYVILGVSPGGGPAHELWAPDHHAAAPAWAPDGRRMVAAGSGDGFDDLFLFDPRDATVPVERVAATERIEFAPTWSPDGTRIAFIVREGEAWNVFVRELASDVEWRLTGSGGS